MKRLQGSLVLAVLLASVAPASAQSLFAKKTKPSPSQRVPELILIVKTDPDEHKRTSAAEELREYDATVFMEIVPVLVDVLRHDKKLGVRQEALASLTKIRPISATAGHAIEKAAADDESWRVRLQAKTALAKYHVAGYSAKTTDAALAANTRKATFEPPLVAPAPPAPNTIAPASTPPPPRPIVFSTAYPRPLPTGAPEEPNPLPVVRPTASPPANPPTGAPPAGPSLFP